MMPLPQMRGTARSAGSPIAAAGFGLWRRGAGLSRRLAGALLRRLGVRALAVAERLEWGRLVGLRERQTQYPGHLVVATGPQRGHRFGFVTGRVGHDADHEKRCGC